MKENVVILPFSRFRPRILPIMILAVFIMLSVRINMVWNGISQWPGSVVASNTNAEAKSGITHAVAAVPEMNPGEKKKAPETRDVTRFSQSEIDLLQALSARREALEKIEGDLKLREEVVKASEKKLSEKTADLESMKSELLRLVGRRKEVEDERLKSLVKIYESMKPKEAAQILGQLDTDISASVIERMKESKSALILGEMSPDRAKVITDILVNKKVASTSKN